MESMPIVQQSLKEQGVQCTVFPSSSRFEYFPRNHSVNLWATDVVANIVLSSPHHNVRVLVLCSLLPF